MTDIQRIGAIGSEIDLRDNAKYILTADGFKFTPHSTQIIVDIDGGDVVMPRDEDNYFDSSNKIIILGKPFTVRRANRDVIINMLKAASLYTTSQGRRGVPAFYSEQWGDDPSPDVYPIVTGRLVETSRDGFAAYFEMELRLTVRDKL